MSIKNPIGPPITAQSGSIECIKEIKRLIKEKERITFSEFMEAALYTPGVGYYTGENKPWGAGGDYVTSLDVSSEYGRAIAKQILQMSSNLPDQRPFHIIEAGGGRGLLIKWVMDAVIHLSGDDAERFVFSMIERGSSNEGLPGLHVFATLDEFKERFGEVGGVIFSNELLDAIPFERVRWSGGEPRQVMVELDSDGELKESLREESSHEITEFFSDMGVSPSEETQAEVSLGALQWLEEASNILEKGYIITVDYGKSSKELYSNSVGTYMCHHKHTRNEEPYINIGEQDITAHLDFSALKKKGISCGLTTLGYTTQSAFLLGSGILDGAEVASTADDMTAESIAHNRGIRDLVLPGGVGDTMKVLIQSKNVDDGKELMGLTFKNLVSRL